jgi:type I restriction enzyme S subunit
VDSKWIFYLLQDKRFYDYIEPLQTGASYPAVTDGLVKDYYIHIPPLIDQQIIVAHLDSLSSNIRKLEELQQKTIAECDALKQAMLREVFE